MLSSTFVSRRVRAHAVLGLAAAALMPNLASATIYFSAPQSPKNDWGQPAPPTALLAVDEVGGGLTTVGDVTLNGQGVGIGALALDSRGTLYGFIVDKQLGSRLVTIDRETAEATLVGDGSWVAGERINGAAFDRTDTLWVTSLQTTKLYAFDIDSLSLVGDGAALPEGADISGHDLSFNLANECFFIATYKNGIPEVNTSTQLYSCDVVEGTFTPVGQLTGIGFVDNDPPDVFSSSCLAFSISNEDCSEVLMGCDGREIDEVGVIDIEALTITQTADLMINQSWFNWPDMAGFPSVTNTAQCDFCGDGKLDPGEECDDGNKDDGDDCTATCLKPFVDSDGDGVLDVDDLCDGFDDSIDADLDTIPDECDNCPDVANADQADDNENGIGDACDDAGTTTSGGTETSGGDTSGTTGDATTSGGTGDSMSGTGGIDTTSGGDSMTGGATTGSDGSAGSSDSASASSTGGQDEGEGCGCQSTSPSSPWGFALACVAALGLRRRRG